jgi:glucosamine--fructose-6-phosphate aminotransferase (isomerizing)
MCGVVACHVQAAAQPVLTRALTQLEYRGYDSAGLALVPRGGEDLTVVSAQGRLAHLLHRLPSLDGNAPGIGIAHTRWATHGAPTEANAHPHRDCSGTVAVVHNGVIENAGDLRAELVAAGHELRTEVDSEVIVHLIEAALHAEPEGAAGRLVRAVAAAARRLSGSWGLAVVARGDDGVVLARHRSPLLVAEVPAGSMAASDAAALDAEATAVWALEDGQLVELSRTVQFYDRYARAVARPDMITVGRPVEVIDPDAPLDRTATEIGEQASVLDRLVAEHLGSVADGRLSRSFGLPPIERVRFVACGSSRYAAAAIAGVFRYGGIPTRVVTASEHQAVPSEHGELTIAISQSGETADVLAAAEVRTGSWIALTNAPHSSLARIVDAVFDLGAGTEFAVAATKTFSAQVVAGSMLALSTLAAKDLLPSRAVRHLVSVLAGTPQRFADTDALAAPAAAAVAAQIADTPGLLYVSRGAGMPYAHEGALKVKELAYRWAESLPAGELKHGPIALIAPGTPVLVVGAEPRLKLATNVAEMRARGAQIVLVGSQPEATLPAELPRDEPPWGPLECVVPLQHLARALTLALGHDVDHPRNLAKSVTVE